MEKTKNSRPGLAPYALLLPFFVCLLLSFQAHGQGTQPASTPKTAVEKMPVFPGGDEGMMTYISKNLRYPIAAKFTGAEGRVSARFVVERNGSVSNAEIIRSVNPACDQEVLRIIMAMPRWTPGRDNGVIVPVYYTIPVQFKFFEETSPKLKLSKQAQKDQKSAPLTLIQLNNGQMTTTPNATAKMDLPVIVVDSKVYQIEGLDLKKATDNEIFTALNLKSEDVESTAVIKDKAAVKLQGERGKNGVVMIVMKEAPTAVPVSAPDIMPVFPGGDEALMEYVSRNLKYPQSAMEQGIEGRVTVRFVIDVDGRAKKFEVVKGVSPDLDEAAIQSLRQMPKWKPAQKDGVNVPTFWVMPLLFRLNR